MFNGQSTATAILFALLAVPVLHLYPTQQLQQIAKISSDFDNDNIFGNQTESLSGLLHGGIVGNTMPAVPYTSSVTKNEAGVYSLVYAGWLVSSSLIYNVARCCMLMAGFAVSGQKTLMGTSIRKCASPLIGATIGGILCLFGQIGSFIGNIMFSKLLVGSSVASTVAASSVVGGPIATFTLASFIPHWLKSSVITIIVTFSGYIISPCDPGLTITGDASNFSNDTENVQPSSVRNIAASECIQEYLNASWTAWDLFPYIYAACSILTVVMLIIPSYREYKRIYNKRHSNRLTEHNLLLEESESDKFKTA